MKPFTCLWAWSWESQSLPSQPLHYTACLQDSEDQNKAIPGPTGSLESPSQDLNFAIYLGAGDNYKTLEFNFVSLDLTFLFAVFNFLKLLTAKIKKEEKTVTL